MTELPHNYPLPRQDTDPRFTFGLLREVADVLGRHGYPPLQGLDLVHLQQALFGFLYKAASKPASEPGS